MASVRRPKVVAFDIIDTVFSIEPLDGRLAALGLPSGTHRRLYAEALRDAMALAAANRFAPFVALMKANLRALLADAGRDASDAALDHTVAVMKELPPHPDAAESVRELAASGIRVFALSNGAEASTRALLDRAGMTGDVAEILSVEAVKLAKPRAEVYHYAVETARATPEDVMLVACHPWDVQGAKAAGLSGGFVARGRPYPADVMVAPDITGESLGAVVRQVLALP